MDENQIEILDRWFEAKEKDHAFGVYHHELSVDGEDVYAVGRMYVEEFLDFLRENYEELISIDVHSGGSGIWFSSEDLTKASFY